MFAFQLFIIYIVLKINLFYCYDLFNKSSLIGTLNDGNKSQEKQRIFGFSIFVIILLSDIFLLKTIPLIK